MYHEPVLLTETIDALNLASGHVVVDGTIGGGGHAQAILQRIIPHGTLLGFDQDHEAIEHVRGTLQQQYPNNLILIHDNFAHLTKYTSQFSQLQHIQAALLDIGVSWNQLRTEGRGFSFKYPQDPLDMRMDQRQDRTAADILTTASAEDLYSILHDFGEEPNARRITRFIIERRKDNPLRTIQDLLECVEQGYRGRSKPKTHMATRTLQALRIAVNRELDILPLALHDYIAALTPGGRLAIITFHPLEDRIVKQYFHKESHACICPSELPVCICNHKATVKVITKKPITPQPAEIKQNPKSRTAKLRVVEKL